MMMMRKRRRHLKDTWKDAEILFCKTCNRTELNTWIVKDASVKGKYQTHIIIYFVLLWKLCMCLQ
jgi:hypothetical protein